MSDNELRAILARLPQKRAAARAFADHRDASTGVWADLFGWLAAEVADLDADERATFDRITTDCWTPRR